MAGEPVDGFSAVTAPPHLRADPNIVFEDLHLVPMLAKAHGILMVFGVHVHAAFQLLGYALMISGLETRICLHNNGHTILGTVIVVFLLIQPIIGFWHHHRFKKTQSKSVRTHTHIWIGRIFLLLGIVNGGTGLKLADNTRGGIIAYGVIAGVFGVTWISIAASCQGKLILKSKKAAPETTQP
ncbi:hypothetical protein BJX61DRAFT_533967 [Aspergillus egyptiacus]|nr:hypothetical protein BJX61DRAFT_533967 [Aspergillus egyptiacus]